MNPQNKSYLRGLSEEFGESTNSIRLELNRFEQAGMLNSEMEGNKKLFKANPSFPLFEDLQGIVRKFVGIDQVIERITSRLGNLEEAYLMGDFAKGKSSDCLEILLIGKDLEEDYLKELVKKTETLVNKSIIYQVKDDKKNIFEGQSPLLIWKNHE